MNIAIIGAGIAGLACADALRDAGHLVTLFDKGRGAGGRMSTRRVEANGTALQFDHGAQYFTARDPAFVARVLAWEAAGVAAHWPAAGGDAWVGTPAMNAPIKAMAGGHDVCWGTRIEALVEDGGWRLTGETDDRRYDAIVVAVPAEQVAPLLQAHQPEFARQAVGTRSDPSWTVMAAFGAQLPIETDVIRDAGAIGWAARDSAKPGRGGGETWVIQASPAWSTAHLEDDRDAVAHALLALFAAQTGVALPEPTYLGAHRWRYAKSGGRDGPLMLWDAERRIGACGDWLAAPRVEAAWLSGRAMAAAIPE